jgi:2'-5' RNA ligase
VRLFVAIDIDPATRAELRRVRDALERRLASSRRAPRVTWVAEEAAHVTVRFIGEVANETTERIRTALETPLELPPFEMAFAGLGAFPNHRRPRVIWIGAPTGQAEAARVAAAVNARLDTILGIGDNRPFRAHLTVGRVKEELAFDWDGAFSSIDVRRSVSRVDHVTFYQSKTTPNGPTYTALCATPLMAGARG